MEYLPPQEDMTTCRGARQDQCLAAAAKQRFDHVLTIYSSKPWLTGVTTLSTSTFFNFFALCLFLVQEMPQKKDIEEKNSNHARTYYFTGSSYPVVRCCLGISIQEGTNVFSGAGVKMYDGISYMVLIMYAHSFGKKTWC